MKATHSKKPFEVCPVCGGELAARKVEKLLRGGNDVASVAVSAEVCLKCGERLYSLDTVQRFEQIRRMLRSQQVTTFKPMGNSYQVA